MTAYARSTPVALSPEAYRKWMAEYRAECPNLSSQPLPAHTIRHRNRAARLWNFMIPRTRKATR